MLSVGTFDEGSFDTCDWWVKSPFVFGPCRWLHPRSANTSDPSKFFSSNGFFVLILKAHLQFDEGLQETILTCCLIDRRTDKEMRSTSCVIWVDSRQWKLDSEKAKLLSVAEDECSISDFFQTFSSPMSIFWLPRPVIYNKNMSDEERLARRQASRCPWMWFRWLQRKVKMWRSWRCDPKPLKNHGVFFFWNFLWNPRFFWRFSTKIQKKTHIIFWILQNSKNNPRVFQNSKKNSNLPKYLWNFGKVELEQQKQEMFHLITDMCSIVSKNSGTPKWMVYKGKPY